MNSKAAYRKKEKPSTKGGYLNTTPHRFVSSKALLVLVILAVTFFCFFPVLRGGFTNWDDPKYLLENNLVKYLSWANIKELFFDVDLKGRSYVPLSQVTFALEHHFFRLDPMVYHLNNLLLHLFNTALVFWLVWLLCRKTDVSTITSLLFGIHPMHVESVAWITERKDVLYTFFYLLAAINYLLYLRSHRYKWGFYFLSAIFFALSLLSKSMPVTLPIILLLIDYLMRRKPNLPMFLDKIPFFAMAFAWGIVTIIKAQATDSIAGGEAFSWIERALFVFNGIIFYFYKLFAPVHLSCFYPYPNLIDGHLPIIYYLAPALVSLLGFLVYKSAGYTRSVVFGTLFFLVTVSIVLQFVPVGPNLVTDRYTYVSYIGWFFIIGKCYSYLLGKVGDKFKTLRITVILVFAVYAVMLFYLCNQRCRVWQNSLTLWTDMISKYPNTSEGYLNRGQYNTENDELDKALADYNIVLSIKPNSTLAYINRGNVYGRKNQFDKALDDYSKAISLSPGSSKIYLNRGNVYGIQEKQDSAIADFTKAISMEYNYLDAYINRAISYSKIRDFDNAFRDFNKALEINPNAMNAYAMRAYAFLDQGSYDNAIADYGKLIKFNPLDGNYYFYRGLAFQRKNDNNAAIKDYSMTLKINPANSSAYLNRSICYDTLGDTRRALDDALAAQKTGQQVNQAYIDRLQSKVKGGR